MEKDGKKWWDGRPLSDGKNLFVGNASRHRRRFLSQDFLFAVVPFTAVLLICATVMTCVPRYRDAAGGEKKAASGHTGGSREDIAARYGIDICNPVREAPAKFPRNAKMPDKRESEVSGAISNTGFSPGRDLVYVTDSRVWWESDNDGDADDECDHTMHKAMEIPFRRLVNLVSDAGWQLRVQEAYRPDGIHSSKSLHKEGRALDITMDKTPRISHYERIAAYEELCKMAWQAGFDWVYYEYNGGTGPHVHASVRRDGAAAPRELRDIWEGNETK